MWGNARRKKEADSPKEEFSRRTFFEQKFPFYAYSLISYIFAKNCILSLHSANYRNIQNFYVLIRISALLKYIKE